MHRLNAAALALALALALLAASGPALAAQAEGVVEGALSNGTAGGKSVAGAPVTLAVLVDGAEKETRQTTAGALGRYRFEGVPLGAAYSYLARAEFDGVTYSAGPAPFPAEGAALALDLTVYEATDNPAALRIERADIIVTVGDGLLTLWEHYTVANGGDRTYIGDRTPELRARTTLRFVLPRNSGPPDLLEGFDRSKAIVTSQTIFDTRPVLPGAREFFFAYHVGYTSETYTVRRPMLYPVKRVDLLLESLDLGVASQRLRWESPVTMQGTSFQRWAAADLARGEIVDFTVSGLPVPRQQDYIRAAGLAVAAGGVGFGIAYGLRRRPRSSQDEREACLRAMAELDDRYALGSLPEPDYRARRAALRARLLEMALPVQEGGRRAPALRRGEGGDGP